MIADRYAVAEEPKIGESHWRVVRGCAHLVREERRPAAEPTKKHLSAAGLGARTPAGHIRSRQPVGRREILECPGPRSQPRDSIVGADPQIALAVFQDATH